MVCNIRLEQEQTHERQEECEEHGVHAQEQNHEQEEELEAQDDKLDKEQEQELG